MKIRLNFVSNSSSSNFILTVTKGSTETEIRKMVEEAVGDMKGFFIPTFRQDLIDIIMTCKDTKLDLERTLKHEQLWVKNNPDSSKTELKELQRKIDSGLDYYCGGFSDNGDGPIQFFLCNYDFKVEKDNFHMENHSGY